MGNDDKKKALKDIMNAIVDKLKKDKTFNWMPVYADGFIEIWGEKEALRQCREISRSEGATPKMSRFCHIVTNKIQSIDTGR